MPANPIRLRGAGHYETPIAEGFLGLGISQDRLPILLRFVVQGESQLDIPIEDLPLERLYHELHRYFEAMKKNET